MTKYKIAILIATVIGLTLIYPPLISSDKWDIFGLGVGLITLNGYVLYEIFFNNKTGVKQ